MKDTLRKVWRWARWPLAVLVLLYIIDVVWATKHLFEKDKIDAAVAAIHAQRLTLADVDGTNLPPVPNKTENDSTVAGIDKNNNGIRDDVELTIFQKYPTDIKARAAALQYAMTEQMFLTCVTNTETWKAVAEEDSRAATCLIDTTANRKEIQNLVNNTQSRKDTRTEVFEWTTSHGDAPGQPCDLQF